MRTKREKGEETKREGKERGEQRNVKGLYKEIKRR
jgi:hypothetical protein